MASPQAENEQGIDESSWQTLYTLLPRKASTTLRSAPKASRASLGRGGSDLDLAGWIHFGQPSPKIPVGCLNDGQSFLGAHSKCNLGRQTENHQPPCLSCQPKDTQSGELNFTSRQPKETIWRTGIYIYIHIVQSRKTTIEVVSRKELYGDCFVQSWSKLKWST